MLEAPDIVRGVPPATYAGLCRRCGTEHRFDNDVPLAMEAIRSLFHDLAQEAAFRDALDASGGKMVGVLVAADADGRRHVLKAFSGEVANRTDWPGWVGPVIRRTDTAALEEETLALLRDLTARVDANGVGRARETLARVKAEIAAERAERRTERAQLRSARAFAKRAGAAAEVVEEARARVLEEEARHREAEAARIAAAFAEVEAELAKLRALREERRVVSLRLWEAMLDAAKLTNARGERVPIREVVGSGKVPGGTSDCAVPRLLEASNAAGFQPIALAEAWWGPTLNGRAHGDLQEPCETKCRPILGHLLCGGDAR